MKIYIIATLLMAGVATLAVPSKAQYYPPYTQPIPATCLNSTNTLRYGSRGVQVTLLQTYLYNAGYLRYTPTGFFGLATRSALLNFQRANNITPSGNTNPQTRSLLYTLTCINTGQIQPKSILIVAPTARDVYTPGSTVTLSFENAVRNLLYTVDLLDRNNVVVQSVGSVGPALVDGRYTTSLQLSSNIPFGSNYHIRVIPNCPTADMGMCQIAYSQQFTISSTSVGGGITITYPNTRETWEIGGEYQIYWNTQNSLSMDRAAIYMVEEREPCISSYQYTCTLQGPRQYKLAEVYLDQGSYRVRLDQSYQLVPGKYRISIMSLTNPLIQDVSDSYITVVNNTNTATSARLSIIGPNTDGTQWYFGTENTIRWSSYGIAPGKPVYFALKASDREVCYIGGTTIPIGNTSSVMEFKFRPVANQDCMMGSEGYRRRLAPGYYKVLVSDQLRPAGYFTSTDTVGTSEQYLQLKVAPSATVQITDPYDYAIWSIGSTSYVRYNTTGIPNNAYAVIRLTSTSNGQQGTVFNGPLPSGDVLSVPLRFITIGGDAIDALRPDMYLMTMEIYDRQLCEGMCIQIYPQAQKLAFDTTYIRIQ